MYLYFDKNGTLKEQISSEAFRKGNEGINKLYIYYENEENSDELLTRYRSPQKEYKPSATTFYSEFSRETSTIPFDKDRDLKYFKYGVSYNFYVVDIPDVILAESGNWLCSIWIEKGQTTSLLTGLSNIAFYVEYTA